MSPSQDLEQSLQPGRPLMLTFRNWTREDFPHAVERIRNLLSPYNVQARWAECLANASDSIIMADMSGVGTISVSISVDESLIISIEDDGLGIHPEIEPHLFKDNFTQNVPSRLLKRNLESLEGIWGKWGHTLAAAKTEIEAIGGTILLHNRQGAKGAVCTISLPLSRVQ